MDNVVNILSVNQHMRDVSNNLKELAGEYAISAIGRDKIEVRLLSEIDKLNTIEKYIDDTITNAIGYAYIASILGISYIAYMFLRANFPN
jgi:hypothetical protein